MYTTSLTLALTPDERREGKVPGQLGVVNGFAAVGAEEDVDVSPSTGGEMARVGVEITPSVNVGAVTVGVNAKPGANVGAGIVAVAIGSLVTWVPDDDSVGIGLIVAGAVALGWAGMFVVSAIAVCVNPIEICTASAASWDSWRELIWRQTKNAAAASIATPITTAKTTKMNLSHSRLRIARTGAGTFLKGGLPGGSSVSELSTSLMSVGLLFSVSG